MTSSQIPTRPPGPGQISPTLSQHDVHIIEVLFYYYLCDALIDRISQLDWECLQGTEWICFVQQCAPTTGSQGRFLNEGTDRMLRAGRA